MTAEEKPITLDVLAPLPFWVAWRVEKRGEEGKPTKVPYSPRYNGYAKADKPSTWGSRAAAESRAAALDKPYGLGGIGLEFTELVGIGKRIGGIDLDTCRDPDIGVFDPWAREVIDRFTSYTEISPSKTGAKIFFTFPAAALDELRDAMGTKHSREWSRGTGTAHPPAIELHLGNRYFAVTGDRLDGSPEEFRLVDVADLLWVINEAGPAFVGNGKDHTSSLDDRLPNGGPRDKSRSGKAFRKGRALKAAGCSYQQMCDALRTDPETADWVRENDERQLRRIWENCDNAKRQPPPSEDEWEDFEAPQDIQPPDGSEDYLALEFTARHAAALRYVAIWGRWMQWSGALWNFEDTLAAFDLARKVARKFAAAKKNPKLAEARVVAAIERLAKSDRLHATTVDAWDNDDDAFNEGINL
jgi:putative DNA primase/helicase